MKFKELKTEILKRLKKDGSLNKYESYSSLYNRINNSEDTEEIFDIITNYFVSFCEDEILTEDLIIKYKEIFSINDIFCNTDTAASGYVLITKGEFTIEGDTIAFVKNDAIVWGYGGVLIIANNNTKVFAYDISEVKAVDNTKVKAYDSSKVFAYDSSEVEVYDNVEVLAYDNATVEANDDSVVEAFDNVKIEAYDNATVIKNDFVLVNLYDDARLIN